LYALKVNGKAPKAIVCMRADIITASAAAIASIPLVDMVDCYKDMLNTITNYSNVNVRVDADKGLIQIQLLT
jgi:predicted aconitase with swiveling domain